MNASQPTSAPRTFDTITHDLFDSLRPGQIITVKLKILLRHASGHVSMAHGDMAVQLHALTLG